MTSASVQIPGFVAGKWAIDPVHSHVGFSVRHLAVSKVRGEFKTFSGEIVTTENPLDSSVTATIDLGSIDTNNEGRDGHLKSADFFETDKHPTLTFASTAVRQDGDDFIVAGDLTIKGVTKQVELKLEVNGFGPSPAGTVAGFTATTEIDRRDFGVNFTGSVPGTDVLMVANKISITLEIEAGLQEG
ncbi:YceI family protein [Fodinicola feengrottensis]|uniref:YceI family protein n=1 Tax=Fodinicola feengrottensis TaxID=435914 RepID=A0ABP4STH4_9ACTN|nr:YceI family protein [Fodinicola feengrottensis]